MGRRPTGWYNARKGGYYVELDGEQIPLVTGPKNKATRDRADKELRRILDERESAESVTITIQAMCDMFLEWCEANRKPLTTESYLRHLKSFYIHAGKTTDAEKLRPMNVTAWLNAHEWNPTTRHGAITAVKRAYRWAKREGLIQSDPMVDMEKPTPLERQHVMDPTQPGQLIAAVKDEAFRELLTVLHETGMRPSEAMALSADKIDFGEQAIVMTGKGRKRTILLTDKAAAILKPLAEKHPDGPILRNLRGRPWTRNATACRFRRLREKLGFGREATAESYRHIFATDGLENSVPIATVAELMGHKSTRMIEKHYSKLYTRKEHLKQALRKVRPDPNEPTSET